MEWKFDSRDNTWKCGIEKEGAGVFIDAPLLGDKLEWYGNVSHFSKVIMIGPFSCKEDAQECAEKLLNKGVI